MEASKRRADGWRVLCITPERQVVEELSPILNQALTGSALVELRAYPRPGEIRQVFGNQPPNIVFIDVLASPDDALRVMAEIQKTDKSIAIVGLVRGTNSDLMLKCIRSGANEFLVRPFSAAQLNGAINKLSKTVMKDRVRPKEQAKVYCVMPAKGACGASTVASNLALQTKKSGVARVLLADLDPLTGTISFLLKAKSSCSFLDVLLRADSLDEDLWKAMVTQRQGIDVLLAPEHMLDGASELRDATPIIEFARTAYDVAIFDAPSVYGEWNLSQARVCDELLLVTTNELPSLQATQRALAYLEANKIGRWKVKVIVNRYDKDVGLSRDVIGTALHTDVFHVLPSDYEAVQKSLLEGKAIPPSSSLGKSFVTLGERIAGKQKSESKSGSSLSSLLSLFTRTSS